MATQIKTTLTKLGNDEVEVYPNILEDNIPSSYTERLNTKFSSKQDTLDTTQLAAVNSGITSLLVNQISLDKANIANHIINKTNPHSVTKSQIGLGNVDNTSDVNKPVSTATQIALNKKQDKLTAGTNVIISNNVISAEPVPLFKHILTIVHLEQPIEIISTSNQSFRGLTLDSATQTYNIVSIRWLHDDRYVPVLYQYDESNAIYVFVYIDYQTSMGFNMFTMEVSAEIEDDIITKC